MIQTLSHASNTPSAQNCPKVDVSSMMSVIHNMTTNQKTFQAHFPSILFVHPYFHVIPRVVKYLSDRNSSSTRFCYCEFFEAFEQYIITLSMSKCYGKMQVLFLPGDNSLVSARKSHSSGARGLVARCLLFNPEGSCSNPCVCVNFLQVF